MTRPEVRFLPRAHPSYFKNSAPVRVAVALRQKGNHLIFSCSDNGIGIPKKDIPKIFERFFRAANADKMKKEGTGLGLYVAKTIVNYLKWEISFKTEIGKGTTFFVTISVK